MAQLGQTIQKPSSQPENPTPQTMSETNPKRFKFWLWIIILLAVIAIGLGVYYWFVK